MIKGILIASAVFIALFAIPMISRYETNFKREKHIRRVLGSMAKSCGCQLTSVDISRDLAIGIDEQSKMLFVAKKHNEHTEMTTMPLEDIRSCSTVLVKRKQLKDEKHKTSTDQCDLCLIFKNGQKLSVCTSDSKSRFQLLKEWRITKKWEAKLTKLVS